MADDDALARDLVRAILEYCGALVIAVESAGEALASMRLVKPDLLVTKLTLPDHDGFSLLRQLRSLKPEAGGEIPVIGVGGTGADRERCLAHGFQAHFTWPLNPWDFSRTIAGLTDGG
ncbi:MAG: response regulator [Candidatus Rokubacteria bacterium]|nr:response regulator [Candidatus Rokubacteria bacterium]